MLIVIKSRRQFWRPRNSEYFHSITHTISEADMLSVIKVGADIGALEIQNIPTRLHAISESDMLSVIKSRRQYWRPRNSEYLHSITHNFRRRYAKRY